MATPIPLHSAPDSPNLSASRHVSPTPSSPPLGIKNLNLNVVTQAGREPPHFSSLIGKGIQLDKANGVQVEEVIAEGGFGVIFLVKHAHDKVKCAMKRVVVNSARDYEAVLGEVAVMSIISPKTPHLLACLSHAILHYPPSTYEIQTLMPLCKRNLLQVAAHRMQKSQHFETPEILQILTHVSTGLQYLHACSPPIIHRDIKIENVLLLDDIFVLSDFGSATTRVWDPQVDAIQAIQEDLDKNTTLQYRSPEMADLYGGRGAISGASDIWALGVSAFKLMSFKDPFETILAIQNRNLNWSSTKSRYPDNLVLLVECLLAEHQSVRPAVDEVIKLTTSALASDWTPVQAAFARITDDKKSREEASVRKTTQAANVVMETTVTPRQRPKRNLGNAASTANTAASTTGVIIPPVLAPPKSPKPVSPGPVGNANFFSPPAAAPPQQQTISPQPQQQTPSPTSNPPTSTTSTPGSWTAAPAPVVPAAPVIPPGGSYNPFDDNYQAPASCDSEPPAPPDAVNSADDPEFDVFANAPFDYFKYQPIMMSGGVVSDEDQEYHSNYAANNPFLYPYDVSNNNDAADVMISAGVCNLSFDNTTHHNTNAANSNTHLGSEHS